MHMVCTVKNGVYLLHPRLQYCQCYHGNGMCFHGNGAVNLQWCHFGVLRKHPLLTVCVM